MLKKIIPFIGMQPIVQLILFFVLVILDRNCHICLLFQPVSSDIVSCSCSHFPTFIQNTSIIMADLLEEFLQGLDCNDRFKIKFYYQLQQKEHEFEQKLQQIQKEHEFEQKLQQKEHEFEQKLQEKEHELELERQHHNFELVILKKELSMANWEILKRKKLLDVRSFIDAFDEDHLDQTIRERGKRFLNFVETKAEVLKEWRLEMKDFEEILKTLYQKTCSAAHPFFDVGEKLLIERGHLKQHEIKLIGFLWEIFPLPLEKFQVKSQDDFQTAFDIKKNINTY